jgi:hypothetical protein
VARHEREISPLLHRRALFAEVQNFLLYDFYTDGGWVNEDVYAYSNRLGNDRALVVYNNRYSDTAGWIRMSSSFAEKQGDGGREVKQRSIGESFGLSRDGDMFLAFRDAFTGLEYLHRSAEVVERGLRVQLGAYKSYVFLDWRDIRDDATRPWAELCNELAGQGVSSLEDSLRRLELKPVREAVFALMEPERLKVLAGTASGASTKQVTAAVEAFSDPFVRFVTEAQRYSMRPVAEISCLGPSRKWQGKIEAATLHFVDLLSAATKIPLLESHFERPWPPEALDVLPSERGPAKQQPAIWGTILAWCALKSLGTCFDPVDPEASAFLLFDSIKLREPLADALQNAGMEGESRWRAVARIRALLAHASWAPGSGTQPRRAGELSWLHDPDLAWLLGVHEHEGERYLVKESLERTLWWSTVRRLVEVASAEPTDPDLIHALETELHDRCQAAEAAGYKVGVLLKPRRTSVETEPVKTP